MTLPVALLGLALPFLDRPAALLVSHVVNMQNRDGSLVLAGDCSGPTFACLVRHLIKSSEMKRSNTVHARSKQQSYTSSHVSQRAPRPIECGRQLDQKDEEWQCKPCC